MSRKNKHRVQSPTSFEGLNSEIELLELKRNIQLEKSLSSTDPIEILKAQNFLRKRNQNQSPDPKSWLLMPPDIADRNGNGYKDLRKGGGLNFDVLRIVGKSFVVSMIKLLRVDQVSNYLNFTLDDQKEGYTVRRKLDPFDGDKGKSEPSTEDRKKIQEIRKFLEEGGVTSKWEQFDNLYDFARKFINDTLTYDQVAFECVRNRRRELIRYQAVDSSMIRFLDTDDPREFNTYKDLLKVWEGVEYMPRFGMVYNHMIMVHPTTGEEIIYYPWELGFGVRNSTSSVINNGYGISEIEIAVDLITYLLNAFTANGNFHKQGSNPKGFINIKSGLNSQQQVNEFRDNWRQMVSGTSNSHKIPVFEGIDLEWTNMQLNNKDMEYHEWIELLIVVFCSIYRVDPSELGFNFKAQAQMFGQQGQKERLDHSKNKGLKPLLIFFQKMINHYLVSEIDNNFEFVFTGLSIEDEDAQVKLDAQKLDKGMVSFESLFEKYSGRPFNEKKDTILNPVFLQSQQAKQFGGEGMNNMVDEENGGKDVGVQNPFDQYQQLNKAQNPILNEAYDIIDKYLGLQE